MKSRRFLSNMGLPPLRQAPNNEHCSRRQERSVCPNNYSTSRRGSRLLAMRDFDLADVRLGSKPEKLNKSKCFPLFGQQRTSSAKRFGFVWKQHSISIIMRTDKAEPKDPACLWIYFMLLLEGPNRREWNFLSGRPSSCSLSTGISYLYLLLSGPICQRI